MKRFLLIILVVICLLITWFSTKDYSFVVQIESLIDFNSGDIAQLVLGLSPTFK